MTQKLLYIYDLISNEILQWDKEIFEYWFGDKESYLKKSKNIIRIEIVY